MITGETNIHRRDAENAEDEAVSIDYCDDSVTHAIIGAAIAVHRALGPGLLESAYQTCLAYELTKRGVKNSREVVVPVFYDGVKLDCGYRIDLLVNDETIVEVKCVQAVSDIHLAQLLTYMRLADKPRGLLLNFNVVLLKNGVYRRVHTRPRITPILNHPPP